MCWWAGSGRRRRWWCAWRRGTAGRDTRMGRGVRWLVSLFLFLFLSCGCGWCCVVWTGWLTDGLVGSGDCVQLGQGDGYAGGGADGLPICRGGHQDCAGTGPRQWPAEPLPLGLYPALLAVWLGLPPCFLLSRECGLTPHRGYFVDYLLERPDVAPVWHKFVNHPFVLAMGDATLPLESFKGYLIQDYLYLVCCPRWTVCQAAHLLTWRQIQFSRSNALGAYKAKTMKDIAAVGPFHISQPCVELSNPGV